MRTELGCAGHFSGSDNCLWRRHTQVEHYRISTVGLYYPLSSLGLPKPFGANPRHWFETMVFATLAKAPPNSGGCGCKAVAEWHEIETARYRTAGEAQRGHEAMVAKYKGRKSKISPQGGA